MTMSQVTNENGYAALIVPDERITTSTWATDAADMQEAGPRPGQALPTSGTTESILRTHGQQSDTTYAVYASRGGYGTDANYTWDQTTAGVTTARRGWNAPNFTQDGVFLGVGTSADEFMGTPAVVTTASGRMVWIACVRRTDMTPTAYTVVAMYTDLLVPQDLYGPDGSIYFISSEEAGVVYENAYYGVTPDGIDCVCARWDDDKQVIQCWVRVTGVRTSAKQFFLFESPNGATWTLKQKNCCASSFLEEETLMAPAVAKVQGCTVIIQPDNAITTTFKAYQFISYDNGQNFRCPFGLVDVDYQEYALAEFNGSVVVAARNGTTNAFYTGVMTAPFEDISTTTLTQVALLDEGYKLSLAVAHGRLWLAMSDADDVYVAMFTSTSGHYNDWQTLSYDPISFGSTTSGVSTHYVKIQPGLGGLILTLSPAGSNVPVELENHLYAIRLGGWASMTMPVAEDYNSDVGRVGFGPICPSTTSTPYAGAIYYPFTLPEDLDDGGAIWTYSSSGAPTAPSVDVTLSNGCRLKVPLSAAGTSKQHVWHSDFVADIDNGVMVYFDAYMSNGTNNDTALVAFVYDGSQFWGMVLRFGPGSSAIFADQGGTDTVTLDGVTNRHQYIMAMRRATSTDTNAVANLYRSTNTTIDDRFGWELIGTIQCTPTASADPATGRVQLNHQGDGAATYSSILYVLGLHYRAYSGLYLSDDLATQPALGTYLIGAPCTTTPTELSNGFKVSFVNGPSTTSDEFTIAPKYDYAKEHVYPHLYPSPRTGWRSQEDNVEVIFSWMFNTDEVPEGFDTTSLAVALLNTNIREFSVEGMNDLGTWETIADVQTSIEFEALEYRTGDKLGASSPYMVPATTSTTALRYIHENELAGGWVNIDTGGGGFFRVRIVRNTSGYWTSNSTAGKKPRLYLDPTQWSSATVPSTGTMDIIPPRVLVIKHDLGDTEYAGLRIVIPAQYTADEYYKIGQIVIGSAYVFGKNYSHGRVLSRTSNTSVTTHIGGSKSSVVYGPTARGVSFGWFEGIDQTDLYESGAPDYVSISDSVTGAAVASRYDTPTQLDGLYDRLDGAGQPIIYVAKIPFSEDTDEPFVTTRLEDFIYGRLTSGLNRQTIRGEESMNEIQTIESITIEEEV